MVTLIALGGLLLTAMLVMFVFGAVLFLVKALVMLVLLPIKLVGFGLRLLLFPVKLLLGLLFLPILVIGGGIALVGLILAGIASLLAPLVPLVLLAVVVWVLVKLFSRPSTALVGR